MNLNLKAAKIGLVFCALAGVTFSISRPGILQNSGLLSAVENQTGKSVKVAKSNATGTVLSGLDVSHYQGKIDWAKAAAQGVTFAYAKATQGVQTVDPQFENNAKSAPASGIVFGAYHFFEPSEDPIKQANHFLSVHPALADGLPPVVDVEIPPVKGQQLGPEVLKFIEHVYKNTACKPIVYSSRSFWQQYLSDDLGKQTLWLAEYTTAKAPPYGAPSWLFWQHSSRGRVDGISGVVDLDVFAGDQAALSALTCKGAPS